VCGSQRPRPIGPRRKITISNDDIFQSGPERDGPPWTHARLLYLAGAAIVIAAGLASRQFASQLPPFVAEYAGDTLWGLMVYFLADVVLPGSPVIGRARCALTFAFAVEFTQLYSAPWIDAVRATTPGRLVLGVGFLWTDLICYTVGVATGVLLSRIVPAKRDHSQDASRQASETAPAK
jgi:hypothetical protein